jgi:hypothetical protein
MTGGRLEAFAAKSAIAPSHSRKSRGSAKGGDGGAGLPLGEEVWCGGDEVFRSEGDNVGGDGDARATGVTFFLFLGGMVEEVVVEAFRKNVTDVFRKTMANKMNRKRKNTYSQTSRLENPEELELHHNHGKILFLTVLLLFAQCKMHYW